MQFISCSKSIINQRQMGKINFDVISSTLKSFSKRTCRLVYDYIRFAIGKSVCEYGKSIIICPSAQTDPSFPRYMTT